jgi:cytidyltransferase-like protein
LDAPAPLMTASPLPIGSSRTQAANDPSPGSGERPHVYTTGVFDILHRGHLNVLTQAAALGQLTVGIMTDLGVEKAKGSLPILSLSERDAQIRALPFVAQVVHYEGTDQVCMYESLQPQIVVQGDDWLHSADRTRALSYLQDRSIRLILLPRTDGISTTEIRRRVARATRKDEHFLVDRLQMFAVEQLRIFENYDEVKVQRLQRKIAGEGVFLNPISIVRERIVIDGVNRLEALRRLGAKHVPCVVYDYTEVDLLGNVHFYVDGKVTRLSEFARERGERREFQRRTSEDIFRAAETGELIPNGETFHRVPQSVVRLPIALESLLAEDAPELAAIVRERIEAGAIRFFQSSVYLCDEW